MHACKHTHPPLFAKHACLEALTAIFFRVHSQIGMALFPDDPYIIIVYSNFLISVQENYQVRSVL
jgi:hypothetical protein